MALANRIDPATAAATLERWMGAPVRDLSVPTASGLSCETVLFTAGGRPYVARVAPPDGTGLFPTYRLEDEARIMRTLADSTPVPAPHVVGVELDPTVLGDRFLVMDRIAGRVPPDDPPYSLAGWVLDLSPAEQHRLLDNALATIVSVAQVDWAALDLGLRRVGIGEQIGFLEHLYVTGHRNRPHPVIEAGLEHLRTHAPTDERLALSWGDARIGNMLFADDLTVAGALDWELASIGSPEVDLAYFLYALRLWSEGYGAPSPPGFPGRDAILARWTELSGHTPQHLDYYERYAATFGALAVMRAGILMTKAGILPPDSTMWLINPASVMLADYLGVEVPAGEVTGWAGHR
ncbi:phosphotransferase family protein [Sporichthya polymorpha]|uniref:phosphotransferase family protein n=1 Tax=Sporichthya polymorpha TaxID=35751 RepID=UPI000362CD22|nr:phosphotransferase family protein [Sporichthya polymorpha]